MGHPMVNARGGLDDHKHEFPVRVFELKLWLINAVKIQNLKMQLACPAVLD